MGWLAGQQIERLMNALSTAFDESTLDILVTTRVDPRGLGQYTSTKLELPTQAFNLIKHAEAEDFTRALVDAARELRPKNADFLALADEIKVTPLGRQPALRATLERIVRQNNDFLDVFLFRTRLAEIEVQVCRIELNVRNDRGETGQMTGTGFLVSANIVMTNYHVVEPLIQRTADGWSSQLEDVTVRFDYKKIGADVVNPGVTYRLATPWLIDQSPDESRGPAGEALDYALIRLDGDAGNEAVGGWPGVAGPPKRGWMPLKRSGYPFRTDTELIIFQHPSGSPLAIAFDTNSIISTNAQGTRVRYRTNTEAGSSGSPCFNSALNLVALHHAGDPAYGPATFNEGIPIDAIVTVLESRHITLTN